MANVTANNKIKPIRLSSLKLATFIFSPNTIDDGDTFASGIKKIVFALWESLDPNPPESTKYVGVPFDKNGVFTFKSDASFRTGRLHVFYR
jgi:hypothetical protein